MVTEMVQREAKRQGALWLPVRAARYRCALCGLCHAAPVRGSERLAPRSAGTAARNAADRLLRGCLCAALV